MTTYILMIFWWGSWAGQQSHIEFNSKANCETAKQVVLAEWKKDINGKLTSFCVQK